ncbi:hypothetical protein G6O67_002512 [Ophiocordyceps sinensis]|nr:hypothetical protein G6O67_002512 [Ophiocordyceps sinensis]
MTLRCAARRLRVCRASFLAYDHYLREDMPGEPEFDLSDPCDIGRTISQRFVEVVTGISQPNTPAGDAVEYLPRDPRDDHLVSRLPQPARILDMVEYDSNAYQLAVANPTSQWQKSIDGVFNNCNSNTLDELHYIAETACQGMNEIHRRRSDSMANEYADNLLNISNVDDAP